MPVVRLGACTRPTQSYLVERVHRGDDPDAAAVTVPFAVVWCLTSLAGVSSALASTSTKGTPNER
jgi:hypothetical protein